MVVHITIITNNGMFMLSEATKEVSSLEFESDTGLPVFVNSVSRLGTKSEWLSLFDLGNNLEGYGFTYFNTCGPFGGHIYERKSPWFSTGI